MGWDWGFRVDGLQIPLERLALKVLSKGLPVTQVAGIHISCTWHHREEELLVFIHPHFSCPGCIMVNHSCCPSRERVRSLFSEDVAYTGAWMDFLNIEPLLYPIYKSEPTYQTPSAHPHPEGYLQVLTTPHLHPLIVGAYVYERREFHCKTVHNGTQNIDTVEELPVNGEKPTGYRWCPVRGIGIISFLQ